jgi:hypothetical protein
MVPQSPAGVEFVGNLMRYAEVEYDGDSHRLLRLGNCEFEFDASEVVYSGGFPQRIETIQNALQDVFRDTTSSAFRFALPSSALTRFESLVPSEAQESVARAQIGFETHLMSGGEAEGDVFPGEPYQKFNPLVTGYAVHHLSQRISERLRVLCEIFPEQTKSHLPSANASVRTFRKLMELGQVSTGNVLLMGCYPEHTDYIALADGIPVKMITRRTLSDTDRAYFGYEAIHRLPTPGFLRPMVYLYGHTALQPLLGVMAQDVGENVSVLNPGPIVELDESRFEKDFPIQAFVPCLGASIS